MKKKPPIVAKDLPEEITGLEGLKIGVNVAQTSEEINCLGWDLANKHNLKEVAKWLRKFRGKPFGFWRKKYKHSGNK